MLYVKQLSVDTYSKFVNFDEKFLEWVPMKFSFHTPKIKFSIPIKVTFQAIKVSFQTIQIFFPR